MLVSPQEPEASDMLRRHSLGCRTRFSLHRNTHTTTWPFLMSQAGRQVQSLDTEALPKFGKKEENSLKWGLITVLSCMYKTSLAHGYKQRSLGCRWVMLFLLAPTGLADTTDYARGSQEQQGRSHQGNDAEPHKNPDHLCSVPHH